MFGFCKTVDTNPLQIFTQNITYKRSVVDAASIIREFSELRLSFLLCNHIIYRRIFWQSMSTLNFLPIFGKNTKAIVHGFVKNWAFQVGHGIKPNYVSMYVYMSWNCIANLTIKASLVFVKL